MAESAEPEPGEPGEPGAPIPKDAIDPELIKLRRARPKVSVITSAGLVFLCAFYLWKLNADRRFSGSDEKPTKTTVADILAGNVGADAYVTVAAEPLMSHALRSTTAKGSLGYRVVPARGTGEKLWLVLSGDGWEQASVAGYTGRLRKLADLPLADSVAEYAASHPRPMFATAAAVHQGAAASKVRMVSGDEIAVADRDRVAFDVLDPNSAIVVGTFNEKHPDAAAWSAALAKAGITVTRPPRPTPDVVYFDITQPDAVATIQKQLEAANLWAARVDPVTRHYETTWAQIKTSPAGGFALEGTTIPDAQIDLVGLYVARGIPSGAYALLTSERPGDYWYVLPVTIVVALIGLLFAWALVRAVKRDLLSPAPPTST